MNQPDMDAGDEAELNARVYLARETLDGLNKTIAGKVAELDKLKAAIADAKASLLRIAN